MAEQPKTLDELRDELHEEEWRERVNKVGFDTWCAASALLRKKSGDMFAAGNDDKATFLRNLAKELESDRDQSYPHKGWYRNSHRDALARIEVIAAQIDALEEAERVSGVRSEEATES